MPCTRVLVSVAALLTLTSCIVRHTPATPPADTAIGYIEQPLSDSDVANRRANETLVDTILVQPDHLELHVGESVLFYTALSLHALDAHGATITPFQPSFITPASTIYSMDGPMIRGVTPGEAVIYIEALPRLSEPRPRPSTAVRILVVP